jgi:hypothetical protein
MKIEGSNNLQAAGTPRTALPADQAAGSSMGGDQYIGLRRAPATAKVKRDDGRLVQRGVGAVAALAGIGLFVAAGTGLALLGSVTLPVAMSAVMIGVAMIGSSLK